MKQTVRVIRDNHLCIGCGLCAVACARSALSMEWSRDKTWLPCIDKSKCDECGSCYRVCPNSPECLLEYAAKAAARGERFGLAEGEASYFIAYDADPGRRIRSASGGILTLLLTHLLESGRISAVIASSPVCGPRGSPHYEVRVLRSSAELDRSRSSHYHPLSYFEALEEVQNGGTACAIVGVPCVIRGLLRLPPKCREGLRYMFCLACSHNVTGQFVDFLAAQEGIAEGENYEANLRDKQGGIPDAGSFNNLFRVGEREIRRNRYENAFTVTWRNYLFGQECCLYCPDFFGADADMTVKDAWGRLSKDPMGKSLLIVRHSEIEESLVRLRERGEAYLEGCDSREVLASQAATASFKQVEVQERILWKSLLRREILERQNGPLRTRRSLGKVSVEFWRLRLMIHASQFLYRRFGGVPVQILGLLNHPRQMLRKALRRVLFPVLPVIRSLAFFFGLKKSVRVFDVERPYVLISGGYGYGNVGDEAQLSANLKRWREVFPQSRLTVLSPNPRYTEKLHKIRAEPAPRVVLFNSDRSSAYGRSSWRFKVRFCFLSPLLLLNARLVRAGLPVLGITAAQSRLLSVLFESDVLFLSGGGYLTGRTLSRLWENALLIRLAGLFGVPAVLSGQTIGMFGRGLSRGLGRWGLSRSRFIYLRDPSESADELAAIGIVGDHVQSTFDDALFCPAADTEAVSSILKESGLDPAQPYVAINVHYWGQKGEESREVTRQVAKTVDSFVSQFEVQAAFVPMHKSDEKACEEAISLMRKSGKMIKHSYRPENAIGVIQQAALCLSMKHHPIVFAMGNAVPTVAIALDDYYRHKNGGALEIFGQQRFLVCCHPESIAREVGEKLSEIWKEQGAVSGAIKEHLRMLKPRSGEVIRRWAEDWQRQSQ